FRICAAARTSRRSDVSRPSSNSSRRIIAGPGITSLRGRLRACSRQRPIVERVTRNICARSLDGLSAWRSANLDKRLPSSTRFWRIPTPLNRTSGRDGALRYQTNFYQKSTFKPSTFKPPKQSSRSAPPNLPPKRAAPCARQASYNGVVYHEPEQSWPCASGGDIPFLGTGCLRKGHRQKPISRP